MSNENTPAIKSAPGTFQLFRDLPPELRLRIWKFAGLQPRIIHVSNYNNTWPENVYLCPKSRDAVLKFSKPLQRLVLRSKTYMEDAERRGPHTPGTELDSQIFGQVEAKMVRREQPTIHANLDIDVIWPHTGEC
ncbi:hypothetical protein BELL_1350g00030 [Botrytis elliptica]|uniref:2EXR domain-containing protein n=1 Tax=Botrytis elliptica TaxID=278938 RepID=A0A4Z1I6X8_9HELO|nr:hypothetical protein BELL_1350g00030 [Botrytis elliptica]